VTDTARDAQPGGVAIAASPGTRRRRRVTIGAAVVALLAATLAVAGWAVAAGWDLGWDDRTIAPARDELLLGRSVRGRPITAIRLGPSDADRVVLVVGVIHGNETAGLRVLADLESGAAPERTALWLLANLNPDGTAAGGRRNARGVDLNRNFPERWAPTGPPGSGYYAGPHALSEPESRLALRFLTDLRPDVTVWFHQPWGHTLRQRGADPKVLARFARVSGLSLSSRGLALPGTAARWQNARFRDDTAFVVELPARPSGRTIGRAAAAVRALAP
jgi:protein MpaA